MADSQNEVAALRRIIEISGLDTVLLIHTAVDSA